MASVANTAQRPIFTETLELNRQDSDSFAMNVRSLSNPVSPLTDVKRSDETKNLRLGESSPDRDADGKRDQQAPDESPLNDEELKKVNEYFENLSGLKANGLVIELEASESHVKMFVIRDPAGTVVRRIPEFEMRLLIQDKDRKSGALFDRTG
jgi:hypothetical protein